MCLCTFHHISKIFLTSNISWINSNLICSMLNCPDCQLMLEMNICHQRNMNLLLNLLKGICRRLCIGSTTDNVTSCFFQFQNLSHSCFHIRSFCICHRLNGYWASTTDSHITDLNFLRFISVCHIFPPLPGSHANELARDFP